jgi:DNA-binding CsgD family transcriptional regulator
MLSFGCSTVAYSLTPDFISRSIAGIYDCAVDPGLWPDTLSAIRDEMGLAYVQLTFAAPPHDPDSAASFHSPWDTDWLKQLRPLFPTIPGVAALRTAEVDRPISQMEVVPPDTLFQTDFYRDWIAPQGLGDGCNTTVLRRPAVEAWLSAAAYLERGAFTDQDYTTFRLLSPHIRRALLIADLIDEGRLGLALHRALLDQLSVAVLLVDVDGCVLLSNSRAQQMLEGRLTLTEVSGRLRPVNPALRDRFQTALARATSEESQLGTWGNGIALTGPDGAMAVSYILPLGQSDRRHALGPGHAAVFVTSRDDAQPPAAEVLSALTGLSLAEARVALAIASGQSTEEAALQQGISVHTLRKHLGNSYEKTGMKSQTALAALVNGFRLPIRA